MKIPNHLFKRISKIIVGSVNIVMWALIIFKVLKITDLPIAILQLTSTIFLLIYENGDTIQHNFEEKINNNSTKFLLLLSKQNERINNMSSEIETIKTNSIHLSHRTPNEPYVSDSDGEIQIVVK